MDLGLKDFRPRNDIVPEDDLLTRPPELQHRQQLAARHLKLEVTPEAREFVAAQGYDPVYGARPLKRVIQRELQNPIALEMLEGAFHDGNTIRVDRAGDHLQFARTENMPARASA